MLVNWFPILRKSDGSLTLARSGAVIWRGKECLLPQMICSQGTDPWEAWHDPSSLVYQFPPSYLLQLHIPMMPTRGLLLES